MFLLLRCPFIASLNDMFRPFQGPSSGWSLFSLQGKPYNHQCYVVVIDDIVDNNNKVKSDQPEDGPWKGRNMSLREAM